jgi:pimeloyl-ACP methyl ester carboxylesterase
MSASAIDAMRVGFRTVDGTRVRCAESDGVREQSIVLTSPWPESVYAFAPIWCCLAERARLLAVDLPGFGGSELRDELMSPSAMGEFIARLIEDCDLGRAHVVAPDVGTAAALFAAAAHPDRIASLTVGSGGVAVPIELGEPLASWVLDPDLERFRAMDPRAVVDVAIETIQGAGVPDEIRADYLESYDGDRFAESMRYARRYPEELPQLARRLSGIETPVLIVAGRHDRVVPLVNAEFLDERLPNSKLAVVEAGHFVWEEAPSKYASLVIDWIGGLRAPRDVLANGRPQGTD